MRDLPANLPKFWRYCDNYRSGNYGLHCLAFRDSDGNEFYFSYSTLVAFKPSQGRMRCIKNYWSKTTGRHLNMIEPDHKNRLTEDVFRQEYEDCFTNKGVTIGKM